MKILALPTKNKVQRTPTVEKPINPAPSLEIFGRGQLLGRAVSIRVRRRTRRLA